MYTLHKRKVYSMFAFLRDSFRYLFCFRRRCDAVAIVKPGFENKEIIYDFTEKKQEYVEKCKPIVKKMSKANLIQDFRTLNEDLVCEFRERRGLDPAEFSKRDLAHVTYIRPIVRRIVNTGYDHVPFESDADMDKLAKLVMKKYLVNERPTHRKISVKVFIANGLANASANDLELKVVCYNNTMQDDGIRYCFRSPKGSVEQNESVSDAVLREMKEELDFTFDISRYKLRGLGEKWVNYTLTITKAEWKIYLANLDTSKLDPEITHIVLENVC